MTSHLLSGYGLQPGKGCPLTLGAGSALLCGWWQQDHRSGEGQLLLVTVVSACVAEAAVYSVCLARLPHSWLFG